YVANNPVFTGRSARDSGSFVAVAADPARRIVMSYTITRGFPVNADSHALTLPVQRWRSVIAAAGAAPSTHNTQPWRFVVDPDATHLHLDLNRTLPVAAPSSREARISCGAALLNLRLALRALDLEPLVTLLPQRRHPTLLATVRLHTAKPATPQEI